MRLNSKHILNRYIGKEFLRFFFYCFFSFIGISILFTIFIEASEGKLEKQGLRIFISKIFSGVPLVIEIILPISVLLGTILCFSSLSRKSEIIAMRAAGISIKQLLIPVLVVGMLISAFSYFNQNYLIRYLNDELPNSKGNTTSQSILWSKKNNVLFFFSGISKKTNQIKSTKLFVFNDQFQIKEKKYSDNITISPTVWTLKHLRIRSYDSNSKAYKQKQLQTISAKVFPTIFRKEIPNPKYFPLSTIWNEIKRKKNEGVNTQTLWLSFHEKIASMIAVLVMICLGLPFSLFSSREGSLSFEIIISIVLGILFWLTNQIFLAFGSEQFFPAIIYAFAANIFFFFLALFLIRIKRN